MSLIFLQARVYEIMYFGVNLILMLDYRLSFDIDVKNGEGIQVLIISRKQVPAWKKNNNSKCITRMNKEESQLKDRRTTSNLT
jgi:hypothetical protein